MVLRSSQASARRIVRRVSRTATLNVIPSVARSFVGTAMIRSTLRVELARRALIAQYRYPFNPDELWAICSAAEEALSADGVFVEVGVAQGYTTLYLHQHLASLGQQRPYYCIDTFSGFVPDDIETERRRGKNDDYEGWFRLNSAELFRQGLARNGLASTVKVLVADAGSFDYSSLPPLAFALVDVDLLRPMRAALEGCWSRLSPGGVIVADDCEPGPHTWDGARQAYDEFCADHDLPVDVRHFKLGYARKPSAR
jgi:O-methyltransferase